MGEFNQQKYINEYMKEKYDRCIFNVPKGGKDIIKKHYETKGYKSLNEYVNALIWADMGLNTYITTKNFDEYLAEKLQEKIFLKPTAFSHPLPSKKAKKQTTENPPTHDYIVDLGDGNTMLVEQMTENENNRPE